MEGRTKAWRESLCADAEAAGAEATDTKAARAEATHAAAKAASAEKAAAHRICRPRWAAQGSAATRTAGGDEQVTAPGHAKRPGD